MYKPDAINGIYERLKILGDAGALPLRTACPRADTCWQTGLKDDDSRISAPWIGSDYGRWRILVIGINTNGGGGGLDYLQWLVESAKEEIGAGRKRVNFGDPQYGGTMHWYRVARYVLLLSGEWESARMELAEVHRAAFDKIAYTNHVKCSPADNASRPSAQMWDNCAELILRHEIEQLNPSQILILGTENFSRLTSGILPTQESIRSIGKVKCARIDLLGSSCVAYGVPHPSRWMTDKDLISMLQA